MKQGTNWKKNGFVVVKNPFNPQEELITEVYSTLEKNEIPIVITSDSLLHLYYIQFDETLRRIEEKEFLMICGKWIQNYSKKIY